MNRITVTVDEATVERLKALNVATGVCASAAVRRGVELYALKVLPLVKASRRRAATAVLAEVGDE
jgi:hypothetical protein